MILIPPGVTEQQNLATGDCAVITAGANGTALVQRSYGSVSLAGTSVAAGQQQTFGPYNRDVQFTVTAVSDAVFFQLSDAIVDMGENASVSNAAVAAVIGGAAPSSALNGTEIMPFTRDGATTYGVTPEQIRDYVGASLTGFVFNQPTASALWQIVHTLGRNPSVTVVDSTGREVDGDVEYLDTAHVNVTFSAAFAGTAYLN